MWVEPLLCDHGQGTCFGASVSPSETLGHLPSTASIISSLDLRWGPDFQLLLILGSTQRPLSCSICSGQLTWRPARRVPDLSVPETGTRGDLSTAQAPRPQSAASRMSSLWPRECMTQIPVPKLRRVPGVYCNSGCGCSSKKGSPGRLGRTSHPVSPGVLHLQRWGT